MAQIKRTLTETYYAINAALIAALNQNYITDFKFYKYGIDPVQFAKVKNTNDIKYPYFQSGIFSPRPNSRASKESGVLTIFDYRVSFFTGPQNENVSDVTALLPYEVLKAILVDIKLNVLGDIVTIVRMQEVSDFNFVAGVAVPSRVFICTMQAICAYPTMNIPDSTLATDIDSGIGFEITE